MTPFGRPFEITPMWERKRREVGAGGKSVAEMLATGLCEICRGGGFVGFWRGDQWAVDGRDGQLVRCDCPAGQKVLRRDAGTGRE